MQSLRAGTFVTESRAIPWSEESLLRDGLAGDRAALERLLAGHERALFALCRGMLGRVEEAEDAVQETFLRALRGLSGFRAHSSFRTWLFRIAIRVCLDWKRARRPQSALSDLHDEMLPGSPSPESAVINRLHALEGLAALLPRYRALIVLREVEEWSLADIAFTLQWNEKRVQNELFKARRALAEWREREAAKGERP